VWTWARAPGSLGKDNGTRPIEEKESIRWLEGFARVNELAERTPTTDFVYIADREADIYELFVEAPCPESGADWLIRGQHDHLLSDSTKLRGKLDKAPALTELRFDQPASAGRAARPVHQQIKSVRVTLKAPSRPDRTLPDVEVTAILATEINPPVGEDAVEWLLLTNLQVETAEQAIEKLQWYLCRWQIEIYFKILKSGCRVEELQLEKLERLEPALAFYMIIAWRVLFLTMLGRDCPEMPCDVVFATPEWQAVYLVTKREPPPEKPPSLDTMVRMVAGLGGFLNRKSDGFPGVQTLWVGLQRAADFVLALDAQGNAQAGRYG
jgi:hypothetical protein